MDGTGVSLPHRFFLESFGLGMVNGACSLRFCCIRAPIISALPAGQQSCIFFISPSNLLFEQSRPSFKVVDKRGRLVHDHGGCHVACARLFAVRQEVSGLCYCLLQAGEVIYFCVCDYR
jgi:hypothetical protein